MCGGYLICAMKEPRIAWKVSRIYMKDFATYFIKAQKKIDEQLFSEQTFLSHFFYPHLFSTKSLYSRQNFYDPKSFSPQDF